MAHGKILAFAGSTSTTSVNQQLLNRTLVIARDCGLDVTAIDLRDYPMPLYNADDEMAHGLPAGAQRLQDLLMQHAGLLIAAPEYNSGITPLLKNTLDWVSRAAGPERPTLAAYQGKVAALISASPSGYGGVRGLSSVRAILSNMQVNVIVEQVCVAHAHEAFQDDESFAALYHAPLESLCRSLGRHLSA